MRIQFVIVVILLFTGCVKKRNFEAPSLSDRVMDQADLFTDVEEDSIRTLIENLETEIGPQVAVLTIGSLNNQILETFSLRIADSLGLGRSTYNDGLLITIAFKERQVRIEVGTGLENIIKDEIAAEIIRNDIAPKFREEKYGEGVLTSVTRIYQLIKNKRDLVGTTPGKK